MAFVALILHGYWVQSLDNQESASQHDLLSIIGPNISDEVWLSRSEAESSAGSTLEPTQASTSRLATDGDDSTRFAASESAASLEVVDDDGISQARPSEVS